MALPQMVLNHPNDSITYKNKWVDMLEMKVFIPARKFTLENIGRGDFSHIIDNFYVMSFPSSMSLYNKIRAENSNYVILDFRSESEKAYQPNDSNLISLPTEDGKPFSETTLQVLKRIANSMEKKKIFFTCRQGRNRSVMAATLVIALKYDKSIEESFKIVSKKRKFCRILPEQLSSLGETCLR